MLFWGRIYIFATTISQTTGINLILHCMRTSLLFVIATATVLILTAKNTNAIDSDSYEQLSSVECTMYSPDLPDLPLDDDFLCGDVNEDGLINVLDIISMVNYILGANPDPFNLDAADVSVDDLINVLDIIGIVNIILETPGIPCPCVQPVDYEGEVYHTVKIGDQCWLKKNLDVGVMVNSDGGGYLQANNGVVEKFCYENNEAHCETYGGMYEWPEAMQYVTEDGVQGICPFGWHIPTDNEFKELEGTVDSQYPVGDPVWDLMDWRGFDAGSQLKEAGTVHWDPPNSDATNESGFTGLPGGFRFYNDGGFYYLGYGGYFWSSTQSDADFAMVRYLRYSLATVNRNSLEKADGFSIRCIKGCWPQPTQADAGPDQLNLPGTSTFLGANTPTSGSGVWSIVSGTGGTFVDPWSPNAEFQGMEGNEYTLSWSIATVCGNSVDEVVISFAPQGFTCGDELSYEGHSYATVLIGNQCWMEENLNIGTMIMSNTGGQIQTDNGLFEKYCHGNVATNCDIYGGLYEWREAMQYVTIEGAQGICPDDWHIPTDSEWKILEGTVDSQFPVGDAEWDGTGWRGQDAGGKLKELGTIHWDFPNTGGTNESGFTALPGGNRASSNGAFNPLRIYGYFWSSTPYPTYTNLAWGRYLHYSYAEINRNDFNKANGFSIRCLKNE